MRVKTKILRLIVISAMIFISIGSISFAGIAVLGELTHEYTVQPGDENRGTIVLHNKGNEPVAVRLSIRDYLFNAEGKTWYLQPGSVDRSNSSWITLERSRVTVPPDDTVTINYVLATPDDRDMTGTYWSIILVEPIVDELEYMKNSKEINISIREAVRFGIQIVSSIGDSGEKNIEFKSSALSLSGNDSLLLSVDIENHGERWLRPNFWVELYNDNGKVIGRFSGKKLRIYPGTSIRQNIDLGKLRAGKYMALVVADGGDEYIVGAEYKINME